MLTRPARESCCESLGPDAWSSPLEVAVQIRLAIVTAIAWTAASGLALAQSDDAHDDVYRQGQINKASIVMLAETGLVPEPLAATIACWLHVTRC